MVIADDHSSLRHRDVVILLHTKALLQLAFQEVKDPAPKYPSR
jgi:hypothetical protein